MRSSIPESSVAAAILLLGLFCIFVAGCGGSEQESSVEKSEEEAGVEEVTNEGAAVVELEPANDSGTSGVATFTETTNGVEIRLDVRGLPDPGAMYLSHLHPGACGDDRADQDHEETGEDHGHDDPSAQEGGSDEIEYPLTPVDSDAEGSGSSTTLLEDVTIEDLLSGEPKYINVHAPGSGDELPPDVACSSLS